LKSGDSVIETQRLFRRRFNIERHRDIPSRNTILRWVTFFRTGGTVMKKKPSGPFGTAKILENVERVYVEEAITKSRTRSAQRHAAELRMCESTVRDTTIMMSDKAYFYLNGWVNKEKFQYVVPDLTPLDFFLWGYVKDKVMFEPPTTKENMKQRIRDACASVTPKMLTNVRTTLMFRVNKCLQARGGHFQHLI
ncbi:hypothetical protein WN55_05873, partial [Dufourea novaeangliae]